MTDAGQPPAAPRSLEPDHVIDGLLDVADVPREHGVEAQAQAAALAARPDTDDPTLRPLDDVAFVTVDNDGSRDLDQALHVDTTATGWRARYALADASHYVQPGSAVWRGAMLRGASLYAPDRAIGMLPPVLSEELVSLNPGVPRRALVFDMTVSAAGLVERCDVVRARVRSRLQLTYEGVQRVVDGECPLDRARASQPRSLAVRLDDGDALAIQASLLALRDMGQALERAQKARGVMPFDRTESEVRVTGTPPRFDVEPRARLGSERWNEQLSLACNMQGARLLEAFEADDNTLEPIYRVHDAPGSARLRSLEKTLQTLTQRLGLQGAWARNRKPDTSLVDWFSALPDNAPRLKRAMQRQVLRAQNASSYEPSADRHHALAADSYARFSSPMREIVGIQTHLVLLDALGLQPHAGARDSGLRDAVIAAAQASRSRQKALDRGIQFAVIASLFDRDLAAGQERDSGPVWRDGTLLGLDSHKLHVGLDGTALDVKVYLEDLNESSGTDWTLDPVSATPADQRPALLLGDGVRVRAVRFDAQRNRYVLAIKSLGNRPSLADKRRGALKRRSKRQAAIRRRAMPRAPRA